MITLNAQVVVRPHGIVLFFDSQYSATAYRVGPTGDHLTAASSIVLLSDAVIEVNAGDVIEFSDSVGPLGFVSIDAAGSPNVFLGNIQLTAPAPAAASLPNAG